MGTDVHGYLEYNTIEFSDEDSWVKMMDIGLIVERDYDVFAVLFGVRLKEGITPIAFDRGIPVEKIYKNELSGLNKVTRISWKELYPIINNWKQLIGWSTLFSVMKILSAQCGSENVRLVVGFDN